MKIVDLKIFYDRTRKGLLLGPKLDTSEVEGLESILKECMANDLGVADTAYILATAYHETGGTMQPVRELGGNGYLHRMYDINGARPKLARANGNIHPGDGIKFCGRGLAQITWRGNYERVGKLLGLGTSLVTNPALCETMPIATRILVKGSIGGWFTGAKLRYTSLRKLGTPESFKQDRRVINGMDKAAKIANYALIFQDDLLATGWPTA